MDTLNDIAAWFRKKETDHERLRKAAVSGNKPFLAGCHRADATRYQEWAEAVEAAIAKLGQDTPRREEARSSFLKGTK